MKIKAFSSRRLRLIRIHIGGRVAKYRTFMTVYLGRPVFLTDHFPDVFIFDISRFCIIGVTLPYTGGVVYLFSILEITVGNVSVPRIVLFTFFGCIVAVLHVFFSVQISHLVHS